MISRIWHGWTTSANADTYEALLRSEIFEGIKNRNIAGFIEIDLLRRDHLSHFDARSAHYEVRERRMA